MMLEMQDKGPLVFNQYSCYAGMYLSRTDAEHGHVGVSDTCPGARVYIHLGS